MKKRSFLMVYDNQWNIPNGDPFTGEQRYDSSSEKIMVSDLRIKRFIRDKFIELSQEPIFCQFDTINTTNIAKGITGSAFSFRQRLLKKGLIQSIDKVDFKKMGENLEILMKEFIDVRLFGGLLTEKDNICAIEGAIQFKNLSYSLNKIEPQVFQNTTVFPSDIKNEHGSIGTTTLIPYSLIAAEGWLNEETAKLNGLTENDVDQMLSCLWLGIRDKNSRSKSGQSPILLLEIVYSEKEYKFNPTIKVFKPVKNVDTLLSIKTNINEKDIRTKSDYELQLDRLIEECSKDNVESVNFFTEDEKLKTVLSSNSKFNFKELY
jgi:CRISPR-associated protein Csh2